MSTDHLNPETIGALIDGELTPSAESQARQHLTACHACALAVLNTTQLKAATARAAKRFAPSQAALERLRKSIQPIPRKPVHIFPSRSILLATAAALLLCGLLIAGWRQLHVSNELTAELLDQHLATLPGSSTPQVISTDRHTVKPWFQGRLPFSFNLPEPAALPPDTALEGANLTYFDGQATAMLLFTIHKHHVTVFVTRERALPHFRRDASRAGFHFAGGTASGLDYIAVSDVNPSELDALVSVLLAAQ